MNKQLVGYVIIIIAQSAIWAWICSTRFDDGFLKGRCFQQQEDISILNKYVNEP